MTSDPSSNPPDSGTEPAAELTDLEGQAEEARRRLAERERQAEETLTEADAKLRERTEKQEATAERLRREVREPTGPLLPPASTGGTDAP